MNYRDVETIVKEAMDNAGIETNATDIDSIKYFELIVEVEEKCCISIPPKLLINQDIFDSKRFTDLLYDYIKD